MVPGEHGAKSRTCWVAPRWAKRAAPIAGTAKTTPHDFTLRATRSRSSMTRGRDVRETES
jgi:hypothetical protein